MAETSRRILFVTIWLAILWHLLCGVFLFLTDQGGWRLGWRVLLLALIGFVLLLIGIAGWSGSRPRWIRARWRPGFWTPRRVRIWLGLCVAVEVLVIVFQTAMPVCVLGGAFEGLAWPVLVPKGVLLPAGGAAIFLVGLVWTFRASE